MDTIKSILGTVGAFYSENRTLCMIIIAALFCLIVIGLIKKGIKLGIIIVAILALLYFGLLDGALYRAGIEKRGADIVNDLVTAAKTADTDKINEIKSNLSTGTQALVDEVKEQLAVEQKRNQLISIDDNTKNTKKGTDNEETTIVDDIQGFLTDIFTFGTSKLADENDEPAIGDPNYSLR